MTLGAYSWFYVLATDHKQLASTQNLDIVYQYSLTYSHICQTQASDKYETVTSLYQQLYLTIQSMLKTILLDILVPGPGNISKKCSNLRIWKLLWQQCPESLLMVYFCWKGTKTESDTIRLCENNQTLSLNLLTLSQMLILLPHGLPIYNKFWAQASKQKYFRMSLRIRNF